MQVRFHDLAAPRPFDESQAVRASPPARKPGVTPADTCLPQSRRLCPALPHRNQLAPFSIIGVFPMTSLADR